MTALYRSLPWWLRAAWEGSVFLFCLGAVAAALWLVAP